MTPYALERLHTRLGSPAWFWPAVFIALLVLFGLAGSVDLELL